MKRACRDPYHPMIRQSTAWQMCNYLVLMDGELADSYAPRAFRPVLGRLVRLLGMGILAVMIIYIKQYSH